MSVMVKEMGSNRALLCDYGQVTNPFELPSHPLINNNNNNSFHLIMLLQNI